MRSLIDVRHGHKVYELIPENYPVRQAVDKAYKAAHNELRAAGLETASDDRAEELVGAIMEYVIASGNTEYGGIRQKAAS